MMMTNQAILNQRNIAANVNQKVFCREMAAAFINGQFEDSSIIFTFLNLIFPLLTT